MSIGIGRRNFVCNRSLVTLLVLAPSLLCAQSPIKPAPLPTVQQVLDHYVRALGGHDAIYKHKSMTVHGKFVVSDKELDRIAYYKEGKMLYQITVPNGSHYQEGFDGKVAWQVSPAGVPEISEGDVMKSKERDADMYYPAHILDYFSSMEVVDVAEFEGHTCYHLIGDEQVGEGQRALL